MNRKHALLVAAVLGVMILLYVVGFGPLMFILVSADRHGVMPDWAQQPVELLFHPHLWLMYHQEWYFGYIAWFVERAEKLPSGFTWQDFRTYHAEEFAP